MKKSTACYVLLVFVLVLFFVFLDAVMFAQVVPPTPLQSAQAEIAALTARNAVLEDNAMLAAVALMRTREAAHDKQVAALVAERDSCLKELAK
jgi:hypothetical protein